MNEGVIHSRDKLQSDLIFDETEFSIQRRVGGFIMITALVALTAIAILYCALRDQAAVMFPMFAVVLVVAIVVIAYTLRKRNNDNVFTYNQISNISISEPKKYLYQLRFAFMNNKSDCICVYRSKSLLSFISIIKKNGVEFDFKSKFDDCENFANQPVVGVLESNQASKVELMFDNDFFCINHKSVADLYQMVFLFVLVGSNLFLRFSTGINTSADMFLAAFFIAALIFLVVYIYLYGNHRPRRGVYSYSQVHHVEVKTSSTGRKQLQIKLVDGSTIRLGLGLNSGLNTFTNLLKMKQIEIIQQLVIS